MGSSTTAVWPVLIFHDARADMAFLHDAFGVGTTAMIASEEDPSLVEHGEMSRPSGARS
ncbi:MAG TPA: hypothetical protein VF148_11585 [Acidimicrobiia bacterium]